MWRKKKNNWKYFTEDEVKCKHTGLCEMDDEKKLQKVNVPLIKRKNNIRNWYEPLLRSQKGIR